MTPDWAERCQIWLLKQLAVEPLMLDELVERAGQAFDKRFLIRSLQRLQHDGLVETRKVQGKGSRCWVRSTRSSAPS